MCAPGESRLAQQTQLRINSALVTTRSFSPPVRWLDPPCRGLQEPSIVHDEDGRSLAAFGDEVGSFRLLLFKDFPDRFKAVFLSNRISRLNGKMKP